MSREKSPREATGPTLTEGGAGRAARAETPDGFANTVVPAFGEQEDRSASEDRPASEDHPELIEVDPDHYVHGGEIDRGGIGRVTRARDRRLGREVAIKELIAHTPDLAVRFEREARLTARLEHPAIITVHEAGRWRSGQPFYAMNLVAGHSLGKELAGDLSLDDRLGFLPRIISVVEALAYAHGQGIIHRDLKPANILVGAFGETVVIDWGLAKDLREGDDEGESPGPAGSGGDADLTVDGAVIGTPAYMSPEQARGETVDERTDVYALGAILYRILSGAPPFAGDTADSVIEQVSSRGHQPLAEAEPAIPEDLCTIVEKAMARKPGERYASAVELAADLNRFRHGQLVGAHDYSPLEIMRRWMARHRALLAVSVAAFLIAAATLVFSFDRVLDERDRARAAQRQASDRANDVLLGQARSELQTDPLQALSRLASLSPEAGERQWARARVIALAAQAAGLPRVVHAGGDLHDMSFARGGELIVGLADKRDIFSVPAKGGELSIVTSHGEELTGLEVSEDGELVAVSSVDTTIRVFPLDGGPRRILRGHEGMIAAMEIFPAGDRLVSSSMDGTVRSWDLATLEDVTLGGDELIASQIAVSRDGQRVAAVLGRGGVRVWESATAEVIADHALEGVGTAVAFSPDGARVIAATDQGLYSLELKTNELEEVSEVEGGIYSVHFARNGTLAAGGEGRVVRLWDAALKAKGVLHGPTREVALVRFSDDGEILASLSTGGDIQVWRLQDEPTSLMKIPGSGDATGLILSGDGQRIAALRDGALRTWVVGGATEVLPLEGDIKPSSLYFDRTGTEIVVRGAKGIAYLAPDGSSEVWRNEEQGSGGAADLVALGPEKGTVVLGYSGWVRVVRRAGEDLELSGDAHTEIAVSPNGRIAAAPGMQGSEVRLWDLESGEGRILDTLGERASAVVFSADGRWLAVSAGSAALVWDMASGERTELRGHEEGLRELAIGVRGRCVVTSGDDGAVKLWDVASQKSRSLAKDRWISDLASSGACERVAWVDAEGGAELWTEERGTIELKGGQAIDGIEFSPDGTILTGFDRRSGLLLWNAQTGNAMRITDAELEIEDLALSPDGATLVTLEPGVVRRWSLEVPRSKEGLRRWLSEQIGSKKP